MPPDVKCRIHNKNRKLNLRKNRFIIKSQLMNCTHIQKSVILKGTGKERGERMKVWKLLFIGAVAITAVSCSPRIVNNLVEAPVVEPPPSSAPPAPIVSNQPLQFGGD